MKRRWVVKIGSSLLTKDGGQLDDRRVAGFARELVRLHRAGLDIALVTSGAIAAGMGELGWRTRPEALAKKQAAAAVGQIRLMERYRAHFTRQGVTVGQVLLTKEDFDNRKRASNARATFAALFRSRVIPIINENDTVATDEIRVGDNDTLAALVAVKVRAHLLVLLTDVEGLMTKPPHQGNGLLIPRVDRITSQIDALAHGAGSARGTGGMATKLRAAKQATAKGVPMVVTSGRRPGALLRLLQGRPVGTLFTASRRRRPA